MTSILQAALALARRHSSAPQFARSLEWLLFTALEADADMAPKAAGRHVPASEMIFERRTVVKYHSCCAPLTSVRQFLASEWLRPPR